ncbi:MAG: tripartite tricarboxylate transporter substrate binding protein [Variovorax sp.]|nr:MAG: tripartite tricarboxylate transporter substrate binding protein [Variovorax sp.]
MTPHRFSKRRLLAAGCQFALATALNAVLPSAAMAAEAFPAQTIKIIIPFPPGGTLDAVGRTLAQRLAEQLGQPVIVDNRPGGNATIGAGAVARAPADGYTLLFNASTFLSGPMISGAVPYRIDKDFQPIALVAKAPLSVAVNKNLPFGDIAGMVRYAKANPGKMTFAVGSIASAGHLSTEQLKRTAGIDTLIVPYKGTAPAFQDLIGGQIDAFIDPVLGSLQYHKSGMLKVIATTAKARVASLPDVPTVAETLPGFEFFSWYGLWAPTGTPAAIVARLNKEVNIALKSEAMAKFSAQGLELEPQSVDAFVRFQKAETDKYQKIVTEADIKL